MVAKSIVFLLCFVHSNSTYY